MGQMKIVAYTVVFKSAGFRVTSRNVWAVDEFVQQYGPNEAFRRAQEWVDFENAEDANDEARVLALYAAPPV